MAAFTRLDGAGQAKMKTLDEGLSLLLRINGVVEQYALQVKRNLSTGTLGMNVKRQLPQLAAMLKGQFGMIADMATQVALASSRGASEQMRVRAMREGVAQIRSALEIAMSLTKEKHALKDGEGETSSES
jgi:hypothetical protein